MRISFELIHTRIRSFPRHQGVSRPSSTGYAGIQEQLAESPQPIALGPRFREDERMDVSFRLDPL
jgi:hypothetical protein